MPANAKHFTRGKKNFFAGERIRKLLFLNLNCHLICPVHRDGLRLKSSNCDSLHQNQVNHAILHSKDE